MGLTLLLPTTYRAQATLVLTREGGAPGDDSSLGGAAEAAAQLLRSRSVAESADANLRLDDSPEGLLDRIEVDTEARSSLLRLSVNADEREEARRTAQELAEVFSVLYNTRFGPSVTASVWEAARADENPVSPRPVLNLGLGALLGAAVGIAIAALRRPRVGDGRGDGSGDGDDMAAGDTLRDQRIAALTARERALARRAAEIAGRERALAEAETLTPDVEPEPVADPEPEPEPEPEPTPEPEPEPEPVPEPEPEPFVLPSLGEWTVGDVERLLATYGDGSSEELGFYLESFRTVADADGRLPAGVEVVLEDVFSELIDRARLNERT